MSQGDVVWVDFTEPTSRRPAVVVQGDAINATRISTIVVVPLTSNMKWAAAPGNVVLHANATGLPKDSVANASGIVAVDRESIGEHVGRVARAHVDAVLDGIDVVLGRT